MRKYPTTDSSVVAVREDQIFLSHSSAINDILIDSAANKGAPCDPNVVL